MASPQELAKQRRGVIPRRVRVVARSCGVRALNALRACGNRCARGVGKARVGSLERSGPRPRGCSALKLGGPRSRGGAEPSSEADPARGGVRASSEADLNRGASAVLSWRAAGATRVVVMLCMCFRCAS
jgi:hypothetical protein